MEKYGIESGHEAHGVCVCGMQIHLYPYGWAHADRMYKPCSKIVVARVTCCVEHTIYETKCECGRSIHGGMCD